MSEQINPIVSEEDVGADGKLHKWSTGRKVKWIIWIVIILAVALGFWHQYYMRSDSQIKAVFDDNKASFQTTQHIPRHILQQLLLSQLTEFQGKMIQPYSLPHTDLLQTPRFQALVFSYN